MLLSLNTNPAAGSADDLNEITLEKGNMCEIFGITADRKIRANEVLMEFFSHSSEHRDGWGLAGFDDGYPAVEKEPVTARDSAYLRARLTGELSAAHMMAHIRRATCGTQEYDNTHPFVKQDASGRTWTLVHNGHIFDAPVLRRYLSTQSGSTDSERILCYIVDEVSRQPDRAAVPGGAGSDRSGRIQTIERITRELSPGNKLNFILYDGELMYVHTNEPGGLFIRNGSGSKTFSTRPLAAAGVTGWEELAPNRLHVYKNSDEIYTGSTHGFTYVRDPEKEQELYINYSFL